MDRWARTQFTDDKALGANSVAIAFPLYTDSVTSNDVFAMDVCDDQAYQTPSASILSGIVEVAQGLGLHVLLRPLIDDTNLEAQNPKDWRGVLKPKNLKTWFTNYLTTLRPYLLMAQSDHVDYFAVETELDSLASKPNWTGALDLIKLVYSGELVWDYSWNTTVKKIRRPGTSFAIDAYPSIKVAITASVKTLTSRWTAILKSKAYKVPAIASTTIDEIGIPAQDGAYAFPYSTSLSLKKYKFNQTIQANWFSAACGFMKQNHVQGIYFWGPSLSSNDGKLLTAPSSSASSNLQPEAQAAIKSCFSKS